MYCKTENREHLNREKIQCLNTTNACKEYKRKYLEMNNKIHSLASLLSTLRSNQYSPSSLFNGHFVGLGCCLTVLSYTERYF